MWSTVYQPAWTPIFQIIEQMIVYYQQQNNFKIQKQLIRNFLRAFALIVDFLKSYPSAYE